MQYGARVLLIFAWAIGSLAGTAWAAEGKEIARPRLTPIPQRFPLGNTQGPLLRLDGPWLFHPDPPKGFHDPATPVGAGWKEIQVPGQWSSQGFTVEEGKTAAYRRKFTLPRREFSLPSVWLDRRIKLRFDAVYCDATVWINGREAGGHEGGFTPFEIDVTEHVRIGESNTIVVGVKDRSLGDTLASATQYAAHSLGGITRKVYLFGVPELHIASFHVETDLDENYRHATIRVRLSVSNEGDTDVSDADLSFHMSWPAPGLPLLEPVKVDLPPIPAHTTLDRTLELRVVEPPLKWDCENPTTYSLLGYLSASGKIVQEVRRRFGFREVEVRGTGSS